MLPFSNAETAGGRRSDLRLSGVSAIGLFIAAPGWEAIYANWEKNGQNFSVVTPPPESRISTLAAVSHGDEKKPSGKWGWPDEWKVIDLPAHSWTPWLDMPPDAEKFFCQVEERYQASTSYDAELPDGAVRRLKYDQNVKAMRRMRLRNDNEVSVKVRVYAR